MMVEKIEPCDKIQAFRPGDANLYCALPRGHEGLCEIREPCAHCHGTGRTGKRIPVADSRTVAQAIAARAQGA